MGPALSVTLMFYATNHLFDGGIGYSKAKNKLTQNVFFFCSDVYNDPGNPGKPQICRGRRQWNFLVCVTWHIKSNKVSSDPVCYLGPLLQTWINFNPNMDE